MPDFFAMAANGIQNVSNALMIIREGE